MLCLPFAENNLCSCYTYTEKHTQWHLFPNAFLGDISPWSIKCTQTQQWTLILGWHLNRELGKINRSFPFSEEGIICFQVWHSSCFLSLEKGEEMGYWKQGMWDLYQVTFVMGCHFYLLACTGHTNFNFSSNSFYGIYWEGIGRSGNYKYSSKKPIQIHR